MTKKDFIEFVKKECINKGFKKEKNKYYLVGKEVMCGVYLQKSNYGDIYYLNYEFFLGEYKNLEKYPSHLECDIGGRVVVMSKTQTYQGKRFMTALIEYEEYTEQELKFYFEAEFREKILPPVYDGKRYILENLNTKYYLTLNQEEVMRKLQL